MTVAKVFQTAIVWCSLIFTINLALCQSPERADSIKAILKSGKNLSLHKKMALMAILCEYTASPDEVLLYSEKSLAMATELNSIAYIIDNHHYMGVAYRLKGDLKKSLKHLFTCATLAKENGLNTKLAEAYAEIANTYNVSNDLSNEDAYEKKAIGLLRKTGDNKKLGYTLINSGYSHYSRKKYKEALALYNEGETFLENTDTIPRAYTIGNRALVFWKLGDYKTAEEDLLKAIEILLPVHDDFGMADYHIQLGKLYTETGETDKAIEHCKKGLKLATELGLKEQICDANLLLVTLYEGQKDYEEALGFQKTYLVYKDSIESSSNIKKMADLRTEYEVNIKDREIMMLEKNKLLNRFYFIVFISLLVLATVLLLFFRQRWKNVRLMADNQRKDHIEKINELLNTQETKTLQSMVLGQESERKRLAMELNDHFGGLLATVKVNLNSLDVDQIPNYCTLTSLIDQACSDVRTLSNTLNMGIGDNFGLVPSLKELTERLVQVNGLKVQFSASMGSEPLETETEIIIYRIIQELVSNVLKHAAATKLTIQLVCFEVENLINIIVEDNGKGFDTEKKPETKSGIGLKSLEEFITQLQGEIRIDSSPGRGTTVNIDIPILT